MAVKKKLSASLEDYLEAIYNLICRHKVARSKDIAESLGVSRASVTGALKLLNSKGLVDHQPYGFIGLTEKGRQQAQFVVYRHNVLETFFVNVLGVEKQIAEKAACKAEHALGQAVISKLLDFTEFSTSYSKKGTDIIADFQKYCRSKGI
ncbi:MAG: metal-dependent transcriptional regulator [Planctomycetes bacterium HGW-Planctomycetes-1]|nr:MAG: metal-dependent transcriptional regulator [Planctomycetes bacterium HGW-Planctomycetes-1]